MADRQQIEEHELTRILAEKDPAGIEFLYDMHAGALYGLIHRIVQDDAVAEEIFVSLFRKVWTSVAQMPRDGNGLMEWIATLARQAAVERIRQRVAAREAATPARPLVNSYNPDTANLRKKIAMLEAEHKEVLDLMYFSGLTQIEVALKLHLPLAAVKTRARAAGLRLRKLVEGGGS